VTGCGCWVCQALVCRLQFPGSRSRNPARLAERVSVATWPGHPLIEPSRASPGGVVGCGLGTEAAYLASVGWRVAGIDLSQTAVRRAAAEHDDVAFVRADVRALPFGSGGLDAAV